MTSDLLCPGDTLSVKTRQDDKIIQFNIMVSTLDGQHQKNIAAVVLSLLPSNDLMVVTWGYTRSVNDLLRSGWEVNSLREDDV